MYPSTFGALFHALDYIRRGAETLKYSCLHGNIYTFVHTHTHTYTHTHPLTHTRTHTHTHSHKPTHVARANTHMNTHLLTHTYTHTQIKYLRTHIYTTHTFELQKLSPFLSHENQHILFCVLLYSSEYSNRYLHNNTLTLLLGYVIRM